MVGLIQKINQKHISNVLGLFWLIDSIFQMQPKLFTSDFANKVIGPFALNQPFFLSFLMHSVINLVLINPVFFNIIFVLIQLVIAILILNQKTTNMGLKISVIWGLLVWILGEGMGGLLNAKNLIIFGFPGAALLYVVIAIALLYSNYKDQKPDILNMKWLNEFWLVLWLSGALLLLYETIGKSKILIGMILMTSKGDPSWLWSFNNFILRVFTSLNNLLILILIICYLFIGLSPYFTKKWSYFGLSIAILINLVYFFIGQNLGGYYSGLMTDLNSSPLLIFMAVILLSIRSRRANNSLIEF